VLLRDAQFAHGEFSSRTLADRAFRRVKSTPSKGKDRDRMGEAKRRRQQPAERTETVIELDEQTNEERSAKTLTIPRDPDFHFAHIITQRQDSLIRWSALTQQIWSRHNSLALAT
jgi:hypothetical protein